MEAPVLLGTVNAAEYFIFWSLRLIWDSRQKCLSSADSPNNLISLFWIIHIVFETFYKQTRQIVSNQLSCPKMETNQGEETGDEFQV